MSEKISRVDRVVLFLCLMLPLILISWNIDNDGWFLLNHGRYVIENGFPTTEPFTIHKGLNFVMQQWLSSVVFWLCYSSFGKTGLIALMHIIAVLIAIISYKFCLLISNNSYKISLLISAISSVVINAGFIVTRPQVFTYIFVLLELYFLELYVKTNNSKYLAFLPVVSVLQINFHASMWLLLFVFVIPYVIDSFKIRIGFILTEGFQKVPLLFAIVSMFLVGFINPYGYKSVTYLMNSVGNEHINSNVGEMTIPDIRTFFGFSFFFVIFLMIFCFILNKQYTYNLRYFLFSIGTAYLTLTAIKGLAYFMIVGFLPMACQLKNLDGKIKLELHKNPRKDLLYKKSTVILLLVFYVFGYSWLNYSYKPDDYPKTYKAIEYLKNTANQKSVKLYTDYNNGCYSEFKGFKTYLDTRAEVFLKEKNKKKDIFKEFIDLQTGNIHYKDFLNEYKFTHILVENNDILYTYLEKDKDYQTIYKDEHCRIYIPIN